MVGKNSEERNRGQVQNSAWRNPVPVPDLALRRAGIGVALTAFLARLRLRRLRCGLAAGGEATVELRLAARRLLGFDPVLVGVVAGGADGDKKYQRAKGAA